MSRSPQLSLDEVYLECLEALRCRQMALDQQIRTLGFSETTEVQTAREGLSGVLARVDVAECAIVRMRNAADDELAKLRFERDQLLQRLGETAIPATPPDVATGESSERAVSPGAALAVAIRFLVDTRLSIKDRIAASRVLLDSLERLDA